MTIPTAAVGDIIARLGLKQRLKAHGPLNWQGKHTFHIGDIAPRPVPAVLNIVALVVPPLMRDGDGRGWHDLAARTIVVRTRA